MSAGDGRSWNISERVRQVMKTKETKIILSDVFGMEFGGNAVVGKDDKIDPFSCHL